MVDINPVHANYSLKLTFSAQKSLKKTTNKFKTDTFKCTKFFGKNASHIKKTKTKSWNKISKKGDDEKTWPLMCFNDAAF